MARVRPRAYAASLVVMRRNTSSSRPRSTEISSTATALARSAALTSSTIGFPSAGTASSRPPARVTTRATQGSPASVVFLAGTREVFAGTERERAGHARHAARAKIASAGAALRAQRRSPLRRLFGRP